MGFFLLYNVFLYDILNVVMYMKISLVEKKVRKATLKRDYDTAKEIILKEYINYFVKMLKYKKVKVNKSWYFNDYLKALKQEYGYYYLAEIEELEDILYSSKYDIKKQITWLIENCEMFNEYKL